MADVDIDPFGEHKSRPEEPTDEHIPLYPVTPGRSSTWEPTHEQKTSFGGRESQRTKLMKDYVKDLYKKISENITILLLNASSTNLLSFLNLIHVVVCDFTAPVLDSHLSRSIKNLLIMLKNVSGSMPVIPSILYLL